MRLCIIVGEILQTLDNVVSNQRGSYEKDDKEDMGIPVSVPDYEGVRGKDGLIWISQNFWAALFQLRLETQTAVERARKM